LIRKSIAKFGGRGVPGLFHVPARTVEAISSAVDLARATPQKNQIELNSSTGAEGETQGAAIREIEAIAAKASLERPARADEAIK
jgi:hypothetical protein